ncbi:MAG: Re/Si-specific NAD(P)(+) transhydrogenase subunit alpha [Magnetococcales bacterium]|nr:Re/Si-specific NAD(P)(+) transhydrogenase subunit alpha [Magnetococcales bacterium]
MIIGIPKEVHEGERRVAATPDSVGRFKKLGYDVVIEAGCGLAASCSDEAYQEMGAEVVSDAKSLWGKADIVIKVRGPEPHPVAAMHEADMLRDGATLISLFWPAQNKELLEKMATRNVNVIALDSVPRISRAQKMDVLSSMANIAGYRAVVEAANHFGRFFTGQITAAGKVPPAKVMVIGAGVAGLAAIGAANSLGAIVRAYDVRPEVKEQVESMGAEYLDLDYEEQESVSTDGYAKEQSEAKNKAIQAMFAKQAMDVDIIITTALIPGRPAPRLITSGMVESMRDGSVIVDLAAENGGNCELTEPGQVVVKHGVTLVGHTDLPSRLSAQSSQLFGTNMAHLLSDMTPEKDGNLTINFDDDAVRGATIIKDGGITWPPPPIQVSAAPAAKPAAPAPVAPKATPEQLEAKKNKTIFSLLAVGGALFAWLGMNAPAEFVAHFSVFVLAIFVGYMVVWSVSPALHTPLMSVTNAISGIIVIGALLQISSADSTVMWLAAVAILIACINIFGGFLVTQRMLKMFIR